MIVTKEHAESVKRVAENDRRQAEMEKPKRVIERNPDGTIKKGSSGHPGGRAVTPVDLKEFSLSKLKEVTALHMDMLRDENVKCGSKVKLIDMLYDRAVGKASQMVIVEAQKDPALMTRLELEKAVEGVELGKELYEEVKEDA